jgi:hypothetical protein
MKYEKVNSIAFRVLVALLSDNPVDNIVHKFTDQRSRPAARHAMEFDFTDAGAADGRYRLLTNFIGPRPIALVTTRSSSRPQQRSADELFQRVLPRSGNRRAGDTAPPESGEEKDTMANIRRTGDVRHQHGGHGAVSEQMLVCGLGFDTEIDELEMAEA